MIPHDIAAIIKKQFCRLIIHDFHLGLTVYLHYTACNIGVQKWLLSGYVCTRIICATYRLCWLFFNKIIFITYTREYMWVLSSSVFGWVLSVRLTSNHIPYNIVKWTHFTHNECVGTFTHIKNTHIASQKSRACA